MHCWYLQLCLGTGSKRALLGRWLLIRSVKFRKSDFVVAGLSSALDIIRTIRDPEKPNTLEELEVVTESCVKVNEIGEEEYLVVIRFTPTVPHCSLATLIGNISVSLHLQQ